MSFHLDYLLDLPGVSVETCTQVEGKISLTLEVIAVGMTCPHCRKFTEDLHQNRPMLVRDLPTEGRAVYLRVPRRQFYCSFCQYSKLRIYGWSETPHPAEANLYQRVQQPLLEQIGREEGLSYDEVKGIFDHVNTQKKKPNGHPSNV